MSFLYVDRITEYEPGRRIRGLKNITRSEPFLFPGPHGKRVAHPALLIEAFAQLSAWLAILDNKYQRRPLFLGEDRVELPSPVFSGDQIHLDVELIRYNDDIVETRGTASVGSRVVFSSECGRGYLVPMTDFDDPVIVEKRFLQLYRPGLKLGRDVVAMSDTSHEDFWKVSNRRPLELVDAVDKHQPLKSVETFKNITVSESFFLEHFPRRPIVPGVVIVSMAIDAAEIMVRAEPQALGSQRFLTMTRVTNVRFRKPIEPGDQCVVKAKTKTWDAKTRQLVVSAVIFAGANRAAQVEMTFTAATTLPAELSGSGPGAPTA